jgi:hypothetical protein
VGQSAEQTLLIEEESPEQALQDIRERGYWLTEDFLPGCFVHQEAQQRLDGKQMVTFRGLIATGRTVQRNGSVCTLLCIGIDNGVYPLSRSWLAGLNVTF